MGSDKCVLAAVQYVLIMKFIQLQKGVFGRMIDRQAEHVSAQERCTSSRSAVLEVIRLNCSWSFQLFWHCSGVLFQVIETKLEPRCE